MCRTEHAGKHHHKFYPLQGPESHPKGSHCSIRRKNGPFRQKAINPAIGSLPQVPAVLCIGTSAFQKHGDSHYLTRMSPVETDKSHISLINTHHPSNPPLFFQGLRLLNRLPRVKFRSVSSIASDGQDLWVNGTTIPSLPLWVKV